jgi:hypothetical protein
MHQIAFMNWQVNMAATHLLVFYSSYHHSLVCASAIGVITFSRHYLPLLLLKIAQPIAFPIYFPKYLGLSAYRLF